MGCASPQLPVQYRTEALTTAPEREFRLARFGHSGRYRDLARSLRGARRHRKTGTAEWIEYQIAESTAWLLMGSNRKAHRGFQRAEDAFATLEPKDPALGAKLNRLKLTRAMRSHQWANRFNRRHQAEKMRWEAETAYEAANRYYEQEGDWDVLQTLEHEALRWKIPERSAHALPVTVGYESVGLRTMAAICTFELNVPPCGLRNVLSLARLPCMTLCLLTRRGSRYVHAASACHLGAFRLPRFADV